MTASNQSYLDNVANILGLYTLNNTEPMTNADITFLLSRMISQNFGNTNIPVNLNSYLLTQKAGLSKTYDEFTNDVQSTSLDPRSTTNALFAFYKIYTSYTIGLSDTFIPGLNNNNSTDLQGLISDPQLADHFKNLFTNFLQTFDYNILGDFDIDPAPIVNSRGVDYSVTFSNNGDNFKQAFLRYLATSAVVQNATKSYLTGVFGGASNFTYDVTYVQSYQDIYEAFNGPLTTPAQQSLFQTRLSAFYQSQIEKDGFFHTGQDLGEWYEYSQNLYYNPLYSLSATASDPKSTLILNEILALIIKLIGTVQNVAAAQANSLKFLSQWQSSYTEKLNKIHTFTQGDGTVIGSFDKSPTEGPNGPGSPLLGNNGWNQNGAQQIRVALNNVNQSYITKLQANQQTISDQAKSLQTNVNQSNDAANQQGSVADSILQELATILSAIFR